MTKPQVFITFYYQICYKKVTTYVSNTCIKIEAILSFIGGQHQVMVDESHHMLAKSDMTTILRVTFDSSTHTKRKDTALSETYTTAKQNIQNK